jgi:Uncharacterized protein conserved in bacteria
MVRPRSFASLMDLYENNYIGLRKLIPDLNGVPPRALSRVERGLDLHLSMVKRCKYTTTLCLTYYFDNPTGRCKDPDLKICIYHDALLAEAMTCHRRHTCYAIWAGTERTDSLLLWKWEINRFLYKWLRYCLKQGHCFAPGIKINALQPVASTTCGLPLDERI